MIDLVKNYSIMARRMKKSVIRELLKVTSVPGMISLAGGLPDPEAFPIELMEDICMSVVKEHGKEGFQYGQTEGLPVLKKEILKIVEEDGITGINEDNILITTASQQALDLVGRTFIDASDPIICECPTYLGGLQAFKGYGANTIGVPMDNDGIRTDLLEEKIEQLREQEEHYKFVYIVPDFQNPSGITLTLERRKELVKICTKYDFLIIEDSPYRQLRYSGEPAPTVYSLDDTENVVGLYTFSKIFVPGLRLGWIVANKDIINKFVVAKQALDLCTPAFNQFVAYEFCKRGLLSPHIETVRKIYRDKLDVMLEALDKYMPKRDDLTWTKPEGGLFLWVELPKHLNADTMFYKAVDKKVAYVIGSAFYPDGKGQNTLRLNFSYPTHDNLHEGVKRLAEVIKENL